MEERAMTASLENWLYRLLSSDFCGNDTMPLDRERFRYTDQGCEHVVVFENDAFELGFGYPNKWHMFITRKSFHKIVRWYLWRWGWGEWFGLRRYLWYKLLHRRVRGYPKNVHAANRLEDEPKDA